MQHTFMTALAAAVCSTPLLAGPVNINTADAATLARELKGVGDTKAAAIIDYRQKHGPFRNVDELALVKGIGQKFIDKNRTDLRITNGAAPAPGKGAVSAATAPQKR